MLGESNGIRWGEIDTFRHNFTAAALAAHRPCPVCESVNSACVQEVTDFQFYSDAADVPKRMDVRTVQCTQCFAVFQDPCFTPFGFRVLAAEAGRSYGSTPGRAGEQVEWLRERGLLKDGGCFVDIGCFDGAFLARLPPTLHRIGVDIDEPAIARGRDEHRGEGIHLICGDFETFAYAGPTPDTISMLMVLEHLPRPVEVLKKLRSIAHAQTRLVIEVPVLERGETNDINGFFGALHTTHFSRTTLASALAAGGWRIETAEDRPGYNGYRVIGVPSATPERIAPCPRDLIDTHRVLARWHQGICDAEARLSANVASRDWVIWGAGGHTEFLYKTTTLFRGRHDRRFALVDSDPLKHGRTWRGIPIQAPEVLRSVDWTTASLVVSSYGGQESIARAALALGVPEDRIVRLYEDVRVC